MREIKFRAFIQNDLVSDKPVMTYDLAFENYEPTNDLLNSLPNLMQYTGKKDRNGKDIYEGDRVSFIAIEDERKGHKSDATGVIEWDDEDADFYILNDSDKFPCVKFWFAENILVTGNIHEHPNLIK